MNTGKCQVWCEFVVPSPGGPGRCTSFVLETKWESHLFHWTNFCWWKDMQALKLHKQLLEDTKPRFLKLNYILRKIGYAGVIYVCFVWLHVKNSWITNCSIPEAHDTLLSRGKNHRSALKLLFSPFFFVYSNIWVKPLAWNLNLFFRNLCLSSRLSWRESADAHTETRWQLVLVQ